MTRYPSKECEGCVEVVKLDATLKQSQNADGTFKFPLFELAACTCFRVVPDGVFKPRDEREYVDM